MTPLRTYVEECNSVTVTVTVSCTVSEILQVVCAPVLLIDPTLFHPNFGGVPVAPDRPGWGQCEQVP